MKDVISAGIVHIETGEIFDVDIVGQKCKMMGVLLREYNQHEEPPCFTTFNFRSGIGPGWNTEKVKVDTELKYLRHRYREYQCRENLTRLQQELSALNAEASELKPDSLFRHAAEELISECESNIISCNRDIQFHMSEQTKLKKAKS